MYQCECRILGVCTIKEESGKDVFGGPVRENTKVRDGRRLERAGSRSGLRFPPQPVRKMLRFSVPPGYRRKVPAVSPKLCVYTGIIDEILEGDRHAHKKQRHTATRILERLRDEHGFRGGYTIVREYVGRWKLKQREVFVPLYHAPGHAPVDFGEADAYIGGSKRRMHFFLHGSAAFRRDLCESVPW